MCELSFVKDVLHNIDHSISTSFYPLMSHAHW